MKQVLLSFDYENSRQRTKEERFAGKQISAGEMGHRIAKHTSTSANVLEKSTYYILDAQGNTMSTYDRVIDTEEEIITYTQTEKHLYGSSRLGMIGSNIPMELSSDESYPEDGVLQLDSIGTVSVGSLCTSTGLWYYEVAGTSGSTLNDTAIFTDNTPSFGAMSTQFVANVIPGETYTLSFELTDTVNLSSLTYEVRNCSGGIYVNPISMVDYGHYESTFTIPSGGPGVIRVKWLAWETADDDMGYSLANIVIQGPGIQFVTTTPTLNVYDQELVVDSVGTKRYELTNHLGNVLSVITDMPKNDNDVVDDPVSYFIADIMQSVDYSPFGVTLSNRGGSRFVPEITQELQTQAVTYQNMEYGGGPVSYVDSNGDLRTYSGTNGAGSSVETILAGESITFSGSSVASENETFAGLSYSDISTGFGTIDYAWYIYPNGTAFIFEQGTLITGINPSYTSTSVFKISREGGNIVYSIDGVDYRTVADADVSHTMVADITTYDRPGLIVRNLKINRMVEVVVTKDYRYAFNGMEHDDELKGSGNSYDFGARMLDPRLGRWLTLDPYGSKYPMDSPYMFAGNSPIGTNDPDGKEKIVVVGSENRSWKLTFALPAMKAARELKIGAGDEQVTVLIFKAGYSNNQLSRIQKYMNKEGVKVQVVTTSDDLVNYVNNKSITTTKSGRSEDLISTISFYAHGYVGNIAFGYHQAASIEQKSNFGADQMKKLEAAAFKKVAVMNSYACRSGAGKDIQDGEDGTDTDPELSLAQTGANHLGITVCAFQSRSEYGNILPEKSTYSKIVGLTMPTDETYSNEGGTWDTNATLDKVSYPTMGTTPTNSPGLTQYKKGKTPVVLDTSKP